MGMQRNGIAGKAQDEIVQAITSFALYGFPESHAASFALIAYASAYLKCHYLAAFTAAILNNQPMGFYQPFTIIKDAQRHGLKVRPVDVTRSDWLCTIEDEKVGIGRCRVTGRCRKSKRPEERERMPGGADSWARQTTRHLRHLPPSPLAVLRLGLKYVKGLSEASGQAIERERKQALS